MSDDHVVIQKMVSKIDALTNVVCLNLEIQGLDPKNQYYLRINDKTHPILHNPNLDHRTILMNSVQRRENDRNFIGIENLKDQIVDRSVMNSFYRCVSIITVFISRIFQGSTTSTTKDDGLYNIPEISREEITTQIHAQLLKLNYMQNNQSYLVNLMIGCDEIHCQIKTNSPLYSKYRFYSDPSMTKIDVVNLDEKHLNIRDQNIFNFVDILEMGVGGLSSQFDEMFRRAFSTRTLDPMIVKSLGIEHIRGIMLYGPPGCGKTLIARQISRSMKSVEPIIVNGPELMSKYVGESEENLRKVFEPAEKEYKILKEHSNLHVIIFDEIDSICVHRGSNAGSSGVGDRIVNQLLTKLDGVNELNNILVIGLTNRLDLIDKALLRPGRFEVQIEIGLPNKNGRVEILNILTGKLRKNGCMDPSISIDDIAELTTNYTGAELKGLINSARSYALCRAIDEKTIENKNKNKKSSNDLTILITLADLMMAMREIKPAFGKDQIIVGIEAGLNTYGLFEFSPFFNTIYPDSLDKITRFVSGRSNIGIVTIAGSKGSGKTTIALDMAKKTNFPMIRFIDQSKFVGLNEYSTASKLASEFDEISNSSRGVYILDDIERLIGFHHSVTGLPIAQETIVSSIITLIDKLEKTSTDRKYIIIITGTSDVIKYLTNPETKLLDSRSIKSQLILPEVPLLSTTMSTMPTMSTISKNNISNLKKLGYANKKDYFRRMNDIQTKVASILGMKNIQIEKLSEVEYSSIPIKYYIEFISDYLIELSESLDHNSL